MTNQEYNTATHESPINFSYPSKDDAKFAELKNLTQITYEPGIISMEKAKHIIGYAHGLFTHNGDNEPTASDPLTILKEAQAGQSFRCVEYCILAAALLYAHGITARLIGLKTSDVEFRKYGAGHVVIEYWDTFLQKWLMCDVQAGIFPTSHEAPLSAFEFGEKIKLNQKLEYMVVKRSRFASDGKYANLHDYIDWVREYMYFYDTPIEMTFQNIDRTAQPIAMLVPVGVKPPILFQGLFDMNATYTHSVKDFYPIV